MFTKADREWIKRKLQNEDYVTLENDLFKILVIERGSIYNEEFLDIPSKITIENLKKKQIQSVDEIVEETLKSSKLNWDKEVLTQRIKEQKQNGYYEKELDELIQQREENKYKEIPPESFVWYMEHEIVEDVAVLKGERCNFNYDKPTYYEDLDGLLDHIEQFSIENYNYIKALRDDYYELTLDNIDYFSDFISSYINNKDDLKMCSIGNIPECLIKRFNLSECQENEKYDIIVGSSNTGIAGYWRENDFDENPFSVNDIVRTSLEFFIDETIGLFLLPLSFFNNLGHYSLKQNGYCVEAVIQLPYKPHLGNKEIPLYIIVIKKDTEEEIFTAKFTEHKDFNTQVIKNLLLKKESNLLEAGKYVHENKISSINHLKSEIKVEEIVKTQNLKKYKFNEIVKDYKILNNQTITSIDLDKDALYMDLKDDNKTYKNINSDFVFDNSFLQMILDRNLVIPDYFQLFFKSELWTIIKKLYFSNNNLRLFNFDLLEHIEIPLPDKETQNRVIQTNNTLNEMLNNIQNKQIYLINHPNEVNILENDYKTIKADNSLDFWIQSLPYPLASILQYYKADNNLSNKIDHLLNFFEALAQFNSTIMLSLLVQDEDNYYKYIKHRIIKDLKPDKWYEKPSFGTWIILAQKLSTILIKNDFQNNYSSQINKLLFSSLINKDLYSLLQSISTIRNTFKGHGGIKVNPNYLQDILSELEVYLTQISKYTYNSFSKTSLVLPYSLDVEEGILKNDVENLTGIALPFKREYFISSRIMDKGYLHLIESDSHNHILILPLMKCFKNLETDQYGFYFYNRVENEKVRYVSYHYSAQPDRYIDLEKFSKFFEFLRPSNEEQFSNSP